MITAVLEKRARLPVGANDIYLSTVGGMRLTDPSSDLAVALAIASAYTDLPMPTNAVAIGEVGLAGDLRRVSGMDAAGRGGPARVHVRRGAARRDDGARWAAGDSGRQHHGGVAGAAEIAD